MDSPLNQSVVSVWAVCDTDLLTIEVKVHPDAGAQMLPPLDEWDSGHLTCPICGEWLTFEEIRHG